MTAFQLALTELSVRYPQGVAALQDVTLTLSSGDTMVIVGPNGSGKSTLLHAIAGSVDAHVTGAVTLGDRNLAGVPQHRRARQIAMVHQDPARGTAAHLSLREHCALAVDTGGRSPVSWSQMQARLEQLGSRLDPDRPAGELSGGQRQLFTVLFAVLSTPSVLLLDEPTSALDAHHQALVLNAIEEYGATAGHLTVFVTHDLAEALRVGNRILVLTSRGKVHRSIDATEKRSLDEPTLLGLLAHG